MKFVIAVVMLAFASAQAGILPAVVDVSHGWGAPAWAGGAWGSPAWASPAAAWSSHIASPWGVAGLGHGLGHGLGLPSLTTSWGSPWNAHGIPSVVGPAIAHGHEGQYVAANRGSVHVAPLTGHIQSVSSTNVQPAPGTTW